MIWSDLNSISYFEKFTNCTPLHKETPVKRVQKTVKDEGWLYLLYENNHKIALYTIKLVVR